MKKIFKLLFLSFLMLSMMACVTDESDKNGSFTAGTYTAEAFGMFGNIAVKVELNDSEILSVEIVECSDSRGIKDAAIESMPVKILEHQSIGVDVVTGATRTSNGILNAVAVCLEEAGGDMTALKKPVVLEKESDLDLSADVVVIGGGGSGITAAIAALEEGASVIVVEKAGFIGGNSIINGGDLNAANPALQGYYLENRSDAYEQKVLDALALAPVNEDHKELQALVKKDYDAYLASDRTFFDSASWHALQSYAAGDMQADANLVKTMTYNALDAVNWLKSIGLQFTGKVKAGNTRSNAPSLGGGYAFFDTYYKALDSYDNFQLLLETTAVSLIKEGDKVVGVEALGKTGNSVSLKSNNGVVLSTGGFAANVDLRQENCEGDKWKNLGPNVKNTNMGTVAGDGIAMAAEAGAALTDMESLQMFHVCNPETGLLNDVLLGTYKHMFVNIEGDRIVAENGRRDVVSNAIIEQPEGFIYTLSTPAQYGEFENVKSVIGTKLPALLEMGYPGIYAADTLKELAEQINIPYEKLQATVDDYNQYVTGEKQDPFGRTIFTGTLEDGPWVAQSRAPAAHYTMGGVMIDTSARALDTHGNIVPGLYAAGEITGGVHGANRMGGNGLTDYVVFGKIAGKNVGNPGEDNNRIGDYSGQVSDSNSVASVDTVSAATN